MQIDFLNSKFYLKEEPDLKALAVSDAETDGEKVSEHPLRLEDCQGSALASQALDNYLVSFLQCSNTYSPSKVKSLLRIKSEFYWESSSLI
jgi:hypothetical protein